MKSFLKENSYHILKLFINQIGIAVFGLIMATAVHSNQLLLLIVGIFAVCFYCFLLYTMVFEIGEKDSIRIENGRMMPRKFFGLQISLIANIPNTLLIIAMFVCYFMIFASGSESAFAGYAILDVVIKLVMGMFNGISSAIMPRITDISCLETIKGIIYPGFWLLCLLPSLLTCFAAYNLGVKGFHLFSPKKAQTDAGKQSNADNGPPDIKS